MSHKPYKGFEPKWYTETSPEKSYRSIFKWGDQSRSKPPKEAMYKTLKERCAMKDEDFKNPTMLGTEKVDLDVPSNLTREEMDALRSFVNGDAAEDTYTRLLVAYGKTFVDSMRLRRHIVDGIPDIVLYPSNTKEVEKIVAYCNEKKIAVCVYGGGSSVTRGVEPFVKRCITIDSRKNLNKVVKFNPVNQSVTVQPGIYGPALEEYLNNPANFGGQAYTLGHFPQSFEYSCVGGWVVTRGAGQNSTFYGKIEDMVLSQTYVTPIGTFTTDSSPRKATGPDIDQLMIGNEGAFGILTEVTLYVHKKSVDQKKFGFMFKDWKNGMAFMREVMQSDNGFPSVFRISDPEETDIGFDFYGFTDTPIESFLKMMGFEKGKCCMSWGLTDGAPGYQKNIVKAVKKIAKKHGGFYIGGIMTKKWEPGRFLDPYLRDNLADFGVIVDTLECAVSWDNMPYVHEYVRKYVKSRPNTVCTTHLSHCYPAGANLYFIWFQREDSYEEFKVFHAGVLNAICESGASMSHHHGIGKLFAPYNVRSIGKMQMDIIRALKKHFDPNGIMNPGSLGLDLSMGEGESMLESTSKVAQKASKK